MTPLHKNQYLWNNVGFAGASGDSKGFFDLPQQQGERGIHAQRLCDVALESLHVVQSLLGDLRAKLLHNSLLLCQGRLQTNLLQTAGARDVTGQLTLLASKLLGSKHTTSFKTNCCKRCHDSVVQLERLVSEPFSGSH